MKAFTLIICLLLSGICSSQNYNVTQRGSLSYPGKDCANICGYVDTTGKEYALVGVETGMSIVDVSDPDNPTEIKSIPWPAGPDQIWKEIKVYKKFAYVVSEAGSGLQICNLSALPDTTIPYYHWQPVFPGGVLDRIHALHVDTTLGNIYLYGLDQGNGGAYCASLADPYNPVYLGNYDFRYVHDGYVDNDTLYAGEILNGTCTVIDFTNKTSPQIISSFPTAKNFTHNTWPSPDKHYLFTTDEVSNSYLASYDISDLGNVTELDRIQTNPGSNSIVHNTHVTRDSFAVTSWYTEGFTIVDVSRPWNMIEVGKFDTYPTPGNGFRGAWGVYPFLPSGTIVVSNIENGLHVFTPNYQRACWLEGNVVDSVTQLDLAGVDIEIIALNNTNTLSDVSGNYGTGSVQSGMYQVQFSKNGYFTKVFNNVTLNNGVLTLLDCELVPWAVGIAGHSENNVFFECGTNPFENELKVNYTIEKKIEHARLEILNNLGQIVERIDLQGNSGTIMIGKNLSPGIYYLKAGNMKPVKVIKSN